MGYRNSPEHISEQLEVKGEKVDAELYPNGVPDERIEELASFYADPEQLSADDYRFRFLHTRSPYQEMAKENCLNHCRKMLANGDGAVLMLRDHQTGELESCVETYPLDSEGQTVELAFATSRKYRARGLAKAGVMKALDFWKSMGKTRECIALVDSANYQSMRVLDSLRKSGNWPGMTYKFEGCEFRWSIPLGTMEAA